MLSFTQQVVEVIQSIPEGRVMTYGQVAEAAGNRRAARQVVRILHSLSKKHKLPWHRVVNAKGEIALQAEDLRLLQVLHLNSEGVEVSEKGRIDLDVYRYSPDQI